MDKNECVAFYQELQTLLNSRPVSSEELTKYVQFIESVGMKKDAFLMIVQYCVGLKGGAVPSPYITKAAKCFADDGNLTAEQIQKAFSKHQIATTASRRMQNHRKSI